MDLVPMRPLLDDARAGGYAVPAFTVWNAETMDAVLRTVQRLKAPVILMNGPAEHGLLDPAALAAVLRSLGPRYAVRAAFHLDHGDSVALARECLEAGYTSLMLDLSTQPHAENAAALKTVVEFAHPRGVTVEGELGAVGRVDSTSAEGASGSTLTDPEEARTYVKETGVDALAVSVGNAHGHYTRLPRFDFERLACIRDRVDVPLVLHGGSGTPDEDLRRAISLGIAKVNVASDLVRALRESLRCQLNEDRNPWTPQALAEAVREIEPVVEKWIIRLGAAGRAG